FDAIDGARPAPGKWRWYGYVDGIGGEETRRARAQIGIAYLLAPDLTMGAQAQVGWDDADLALGGSSTLGSWGTSGFIAYAPKTGPQAIVSGTVAYLQADITRGYMNGATPATSSGETDGSTIGAKGRIGWRMQAGADSTFTPFASLTVSHSRFDGYSETSGPLPAVFSDFSGTSVISHLGVEADHMLPSGTLVWASAAWAHRADSDDTTVTGTVAGSLTLDSGSPVFDDDWFVFNAGTVHALSSGSTVSVRGSLSVYESGGTNAGLHLGYSSDF
ncbi:MAG: autotransporter outer membrane beta-barrel domain-containing protein, partial [Novosphingobium sp.]|nr:autotransporter outer membrane beta-barrel domain-containing protein [Novosphingobium sp.]